MAKSLPVRVVKLDRPYIGARGKKYQWMVQAKLDDIWRNYDGSFASRKEARDRCDGYAAYAFYKRIHPKV